MHIWCEAGCPTHTVQPRCFGSLHNYASRVASSVQSRGHNPGIGMTTDGNALSRTALTMLALGALRRTVPL